jgi:hypothetical protein
MALTWIPWDVALEAGAVVGTAGIAGATVDHRFVAGVARFARELAIVLVLYGMWRIVGTISVVKVDGAVQAGQWIWDVERWMHLPNEQGLQHLFLESHLLIQACNVFYASVHLPSMMIFLVWLYFWKRDRYPRIRNVVALTTLFCLAIQLIPVAPPRLVPGLHVRDTPALFGQTVYPSFGKNGPAQLSAMPSVHVAWAVIIGVAIVLCCTTRWRWFALAHPVVTMVVVVVTGNHYWLDGIVGIAVIAVAVWVEQVGRNLITRWLASRKPVRATRSSSDESLSSGPCSVAVPAPPHGSRDRLSPVGTRTAGSGRS